VTRAAHTTQEVAHSVVVELSSEKHQQLVIVKKKSVGRCDKKLKECLPNFARILYFHVSLNSNRKFIVHLNNKKTPYCRE